MSTSAPPYVRERLGNGSRTKKLLYSKLQSGEFTGTETATEIQRTHPLFRAQEKNCFRNCWASVKSEQAGILH